MMGRIRYWGGRLRRFGLKKTLYNIKYNAWDKLLPFNAFELTEEELQALLKAAEETGLSIGILDGVPEVITGGATENADSSKITEQTADYILELPEGVEASPYIKAYIAVSAARHLALTGELPILIYWDEYRDYAVGQVTQALGHTSEGSDHFGYFKPDFAPESLCGYNYIGISFAVRGDMYPEAGFDGRSPHREILKLCEGADDTAVCHIRRALVKIDMSSRAARDMLSEDATEAVKSYMSAYGVSVNVHRETRPPMYQYYDKNAVSQDNASCNNLTEPIYKWKPVRNGSEAPLISVIIANKDNADILKTCIDSIFEKTTYPNFEVLVVENNSTEAETYDYYDSIEDMVRIIPMETEFNYSYINNYGAALARGEYLLFLNNDTEVIDGGWMEEMLSYCMMPDIGAVGVKLIYPDGTLQHGGVTVGVRGVAGHAFIGSAANEYGYGYRLDTVQDLSAVTAACMMVKRDVFWEAYAFDENYKVAFNDSDLCLRIRNMGERILFLPDVRLKHFESRSRGRDEADPKKLRRFNRESNLFQREWFYQLLDGDPYYNPNLSYEDDSFKPR
ncbi:MAG: glycosyltransferase family 2 protein [Lachnospiraceae bacterium]|nr:glycosyltransferase family 2 protein [Lachnospiraceae bacterium]